MVIVGGKKLTLGDFERVLHGDENIELQEQALQNVKQSFDFLQQYAKEKVIYGINTGFGSLYTKNIQYTANNSGIILCRIVSARRSQPCRSTIFLKNK